jgi:hypothetical protein
MVSLHSGSPASGIAHYGLTVLMVACMRVVGRVARGPLGTYHTNTLIIASLDSLHCTREIPAVVPSLRIIWPLELYKLPGVSGRGRA